MGHRPQLHLSILDIVIILINCVKKLAMVAKNPRVSTFLTIPVNPNTQRPQKLGRAITMTSSEKQICDEINCSQRKLT